MKRRGFTLIELLVAGMMATIVLGAITLSLSQLGSSKAISRQRLEAYSRCDMAIRTMRKDIITTLRRGDLFDTRVLISDSSHRYQGEAVDIELVDEPLMDVLDEAIFDSHIADVKARKYDAALMALPCSTFARSRGVCDGGPKPLRGCGASDIYGLSDLSFPDKDKVRTGTILALRGEALARTCTGMDIPWIAETPEHNLQDR